MSRALILPVALIPLLFMTACSSGQHGHDGVDEHHNAEEGDSTHDNENDHGANDHHDNVIGRPGEAGSVDRVIQVSLDDTMRFIPGSFNVSAGETIQFNVVNEGQLAHEFVLGSADEIQEHHAIMQKYPGMEHDEPNSVSLKSTQTGAVIWTFTNAGTVDIACLKAGHFEAGMKGVVNVKTATS